MMLTPSDNSGQGDAEALEAAGRRVLAYVRLLPMAEERRLGLALEVVRRLPGEGLAAGTAPARAMAILRGLLADTGCPPVSVAPPLPALDRGHMVPEEMDRRPWLTAAVRLAQGYGRLSGRVAVLRPRVLLPALLAALAFLHLLAPALE